MRQAKFGGGWQAIRYTMRKAREVGPLRLWRAMRSRNACKTCAFGMGGQRGGMVNEAGSFPEVCKKSLQAMTADMRGWIEPRFFERYSIQDLQSFSPLELEAAGRIVDPLILEPGASHYRVASWKEALCLVSKGLKDSAPERSFFYASGRSSNEAGFLLQLLARAHGGNNVSNCSYYCHQASSAALMDSLGTPTATVAFEDLEPCDLVFLIGANPSCNHPRMMTSLMKLRRRGGHVIVINPCREPGLVNFRVPSNLKSMLFGSEIASLYLQPRIGGDAALLAGIAKALLEGGKHDKDFIDSATEGFEEVQSLLQELDWARIEASNGVSRSDIERCAGLYTQSQKSIFAWTMGVTHHEHGTDTVQWIVNLALLRGMAGKPGAGLMPIRGHSNVQGLGTVGVSPYLRQAALEKLEEMGLRPSRAPGLDPWASIEKAAEGGIDFALCLGGNLYAASPESSYTKEAFSRIGTVVYLSTTLNLGHAHGLGKTTVILPVKVRDEEGQSTTQESMFNFVRLSDGGPARYERPRSEVEVLASIAETALPENPLLDWAELRSHDRIRRLIAELVPNLKEIGEIGRTKREFHIPGRIHHEPVFKTPSGKAQFRAIPIPAASKLEEDQLMLMTVRSEGQFNTVVYEIEDPYRGQERRDVILMNRLDIERLGFAPNQPVEVSTPAGAMQGILVGEFDIAKGCALMYYPECNVLVPRTADPRSHTPAFKSVVVTVKPGDADAAPQPGVLRLSDPKARKRMKAC